MCEFGADEYVKLCEPRERHRPLALAINAVKVDECLRPLIQTLNDYGIETIACCCGHGGSPRSGIRIHPKNVMLIPMGDVLTTHLVFPSTGKEAQNAS